MDTPGSAAEQNLSDKLGTGARVGRHKVNKHGDLTDFQGYGNKTRTDWTPKGTCKNPTRHQELETEITKLIRFTVLGQRPRDHDSYRSKINTFEDCFYIYISFAILSFFLVFTFFFLSNVLSMSF